MADKMKFRVIRRHDGDRMYEEGETREGTQAELGHLVPNVLELIGPADQGASEPEKSEQKSEPSPQNKAEPAPTNKAEAPTATNKTTHQRGKRKRP